MERRVNRTEFEYLLKNGKNIHSPFLSFKYVFVDKKPFPSKFSFVVSGKVSKRSTKRNLFKRRSRYAVRKLKNSIKEGYLGAFFAKTGVDNLSFYDLEKDIVSLLKKSGVLV